MVFVKVRETYDLHTLQDKMSVIAVHTPGPNIIRRNYPGLLMQCRAYRPVSCDVKMACASMLPLDPLGVGTTEGQVAPEDMFNPILYKAISNFSMSQIEEYITAKSEVHQSGFSARGDSLDASNDGITSDDFALYYGLLSMTHEWKHANPQAGLEMFNLRPLVYEMNYSLHAMRVKNTAYGTGETDIVETAMTPDGFISRSAQAFMGKSKPMPWLPTTTEFIASGGTSIINASAGFPAIGDTGVPTNDKIGVPAPRIFCGIICIPPSRLHQLFYRLVCEWTLEFSGIRPLAEVTSFSGLQSLGTNTHFIDYDFGESKVLQESTEMIDTSDGSGIKKVM